jgi:hypothetical protein
MTNQELKNLSDSELLEIIDKSDIKDPNFKQISQLAKVDGEFRARIDQLQADNKKDIIKYHQLIKSLENDIKSAPEAIKVHLQAQLDRLIKEQALIWWDGNMRYLKVYLILN